MGKTSHFWPRRLWERPDPRSPAEPAGAAGADPKSGPSGWIEAADVTTLLGLVTLTGLSWSLPQAWWPSLCRRMGPLALPMVATDPARCEERIRAVAALEPFGRNPRGLLRQLAAEQVRAELQLLRSHRPGGWRPDLVLGGRHRIDSALAKGKGAVLWVTYSVYGDLLAKMAFAGAGLAVDHLSRPSHGFSSSRFGRAVLNPIKTRAERRYLRSRVVLDDAEPGRVLSRLQARLADNGLVSVTVHRNARRPLTPAFLGDRITLAPGAPLLAHRSGAALLPVFPFRDGADSYRVAIGEAIPMDPGEDLGPAMAAAAAAYAAQLEPYVRRYPQQWRGWIHL